MQPNYDHLIIGAGPAGTACGITLQRQNKNVCLIDKAVFPRRKTCAGLVTGKTYRLLAQLLPEQALADMFCDSTNTIGLFHKTKELVKAPIATTARLTDREVSDNTLLQEYLRIGGAFHEGAKVTEVDPVQNRVTLSDGSVIGYKRLIFADGALSVSRKLLHGKPPALAFALETLLPADRLPTDSIDLYFDYLKSGYVWVFPHGDRVCVGLGGNYDKNTDYKALLLQFLAERHVDITDIDIRGAFFPCGNVVPQHKLPDNILLAGDAGGFADPITGEGLYMALQTGIYAAQAESKKAYLETVKPLQRTVKDGKRVQELFYSAAIFPMALKKMDGDAHLVSYLYDNLVDEYRYDYRGILKRFLPFHLH